MMILFLIICVVVLSSLSRPRPYYNSYYWGSPFGYRRHEPMHRGPAPMGYRPMGMGMGPRPMGSMNRGFGHMGDMSRPMGSGGPRGGHRR